MLASKHSTNDRHVTVLISPPLHLRSVLSRKLLPKNFIFLRNRLERGLIPRYVEVLVHEVENKLKKLLGILLLIDPPLGIEMSAHSLFYISVEWQKQTFSHTLNVLGRTEATSPLNRLDIKVA
jgi:hypothetical protein